MINKIPTIEEEFKNSINKITTIAKAIKWLDIKKYTYTVQYLKFYNPPSTGVPDLRHTEEYYLPARSITIVFPQNVYSDKDITNHIENVTSNLDIDKISFISENRTCSNDGVHLPDNLSPLYSKDKNVFSYGTNPSFGSFYLTLVEINKRYVGEVIYVEISALGKIQSPDYHKVSCRIVEVHDDYLIVEINGVPVIDPSYKVYKISYLDFTL